jgi:hypothetical protein
VRHRTRSADALAAAFGLTLGETKVLASLFAGRTPGRDRSNARHHQADGENSPRTHLPEDQGDATAELMRLWTGISPTGLNR